MAIDRILGRPMRAWYPSVALVVPIAFLVSALAPIVARAYAVPILTVCLIAILAVIVRFTPYLLMACGCFYAMSQLTFPHSLDFRAWGFHAMFLSLAAFFLWRTWRLWPSDLPKARMLQRAERPLSRPQAVASIVAGILGILAIVGIVAYMIYVFHFQE